MDHEENCSCHHSAHSELSQTLSELDFERGIWSAVIYNETNRVRELIAKGHVNHRDNSGYTALHYATRNGNLEICRLLIESNADVNAKTKGGATPLHRAAMMGHLEIVELLVDAGADVLAQDEDGQTALHRAAAKGDILVSQYLNNFCGRLKYIKDKKDHIPYNLVSIDNDHLKKLLFPTE